MLKSATYKEKFNMLESWIPAIIDQIKKDLKNEHIKSDIQFCKIYLAGKNLNKLTTDELATAYGRALKENENSEALGEFISNRWLLKNTELYGFFEEKLLAIDPNFTDLEEIESSQAKELVQTSVQKFGAQKTYLFSVLNSVVFPKDVYSQLAKLAQNDEEKKEAEALQLLEKSSIEAINKQHELQTARLVDKYEKKLIGLQKKYLQDTENLKKQIVNLQRKLKSDLLPTP